MQDGTWGKAFSELATAAVAAFVRFWKQDMVQVGLTVGMFVALAAPLLLVLLILWYVDSTGWHPQGGFYKIGSSAGVSRVSLDSRSAGSGMPDTGA